MQTCRFPLVLNAAMPHTSLAGFAVYQTPATQAAGKLARMSANGSASAMITVKIATPDDVANACAISYAAFSELRTVYRPTETAIANKAERQEETVRAVAKIDQTVVGTLEYFVEKDQLYIIALAVYATFRRQGLARRLIEFVGEVARGLGRRIIATRTIKETGNVPIFERLGFHVVGEDIASWCVSDVHASLHDVHLERDVA